MAKRRRRIVGLVPRLGRTILAAVRWAIRHPQPAIVTAVITTSLWGLWDYAQHADAFRIAQVQFPPGSTLTLREPLIGKSLWDIDLRDIAEELKSQQPWLKEVRVIRQLPSVIRIEMIPRVAIAQVRLAQWYPVDAGGFIVPKPSIVPIEGLTRLVGFERASPPLKVGALNTEERLTTALRTLKALRRAPALSSHRLTEINVLDLQQLRFVIDEGMEVRCGTEEELGDQLERLRAALHVIAKRQMAVRYIDVRFKEPVVGPGTL